MRHSANTDDIRDHVHVVAGAQRVEGREGGTDLGPEPGDDQLGGHYVAKAEVGLRLAKVINVWIREALRSILPGK